MPLNSYQMSPTSPDPGDDEETKTLLADADEQETDMEDRTSATHPQADGGASGTRTRNGLLGYDELDHTRRKNRILVYTLAATSLALLLLALFVFVTRVTPAASSVPNELGVTKLPSGGRPAGAAHLDLTWNPEEQALRNWTWGPFEPHRSLMANIARLSNVRCSSLFPGGPLIDSGIVQADRELRDRLLQLRNSTEVDYSTGLARKSPAPHTRHLRRSPSTTSRNVNLTRAAEVGPFTEGSELKYLNLRQEFSTGEPVSVCEGNPWGDAYALLHQEILEGKREPKLLTYNCDRKTGCGGLADR